jgi:hypothetical protein
LTKNNDFSQKYADALRPHALSAGTVPITEKSLTLLNLFKKFAFGPTEVT